MVGAAEKKELTLDLAAELGLARLKQFLQILLRTRQGNAWATWLSRSAEEVVATFSGSMAEFSPDGRLLATVGVGADTASVDIWDATSGQKMNTLTGGHFLGIASLACSRNGLLATGGRDGWIAIWDIGNGKRVWPVHVE